MSILDDDMRLRGRYVVWSVFRHEFPSGAVIVKLVQTIPMSRSRAHRCLRQATRARVPAAIQRRRRNRPAPTWLREVADRMRQEG